MAFHKISNCERKRDLILKMNEEGASLAEMGRVAKTGGRHVKAFLRRNGVTREFPTAVTGSKHYKWQGGRFLDKDGYWLVLAPNHPHRRKHIPYVLEHRLVMEAHIGRYLIPGEVVHHRNGDTTDNRIQNLELFESNAEHLKNTIAGQCPEWSDDGVLRMKKGIARSAKTRRPETQIQSEHDVREWR